MKKAANTSPGNLVISRKVGECVFISPDINIRVVDVYGHFVKLRVTAPQSTPIIRDELIVEGDKFFDDYTKLLRKSALDDYYSRAQIQSEKGTAMNREQISQTIKEEDNDNG